MKGMSTTTTARAAPAHDRGGVAQHVDEVTGRVLS
jgi:hypothetical protein